MRDSLNEMKVDTARELLHSGFLSGITICASCIMGLGIEAEDIFARWLEKYGDEEISCEEKIPSAVIGDNERL